MVKKFFLLQFEIMIFKKINKKSKGQIFHYSKSEELIYGDIKKIKNKIFNNFGKYWNWPLFCFLTRPSIARFLYLNDIYKKIINLPGCICEFGVQYGASTNILYNLREIYENHNYTRELNIFDTFSGFSKLSKFDMTKSNAGDYSTIKNYDKILNNLLELNQKISTRPNFKRHHIYKGDASKTFLQWSKKNKHKTISLAIFDMDIYKPTKKVLKLIKNHLIKGSIVVFDQFDSNDFTGEANAAIQELDFKILKLTKSKFIPRAAWCKL